MTDIETALRAAMHSAVDTEEASHSLLINQVRRRHRRHSAGVAIAAAVAVLAAGIPAAIAAHHLITRTPSLSHGHTPPSGRMSGVPARGNLNLQVLAPTARGAEWYSSGTHRSTPITGLPKVLGGYQFGRFTGGWLAWSTNQGNYSGGSGCHLSCTAGPEAYYFVADGATRATLVGSASGVANGSSPNAVWLITFPRPGDTATAAADARLVTWTGRPLGPTYRLPAGYGVWRGVGRYLLITSASGPPLLWNPQTRHVVRQFADLIDAGPEQVLWSQACQRCRLQILNVSTGRNLQTDIPSNLPSGLNETLTDDGSLLAVQLPSGALAVVRTASGSVTVLRGSAVSSAEWQNFSWRDGGHQLIITAGPNSAPGPMQIASWQPGDSRLKIAVVRRLTEITDFETGTVGT